MSSDLHRDHHFVSRGYLKRFTSSSGRLWLYRTLVSHARVPEWKQASTKAVAYHSHLYTRTVAGRESDEFETWLDKEFEAPAEEPLRKATSGDQLTSEDWERLVRFVAAQDVRTPARLLANLRRWQRDLPGTLDRALRETVRKLEESRTREKATLEQVLARGTDEVPLRVTTEIDTDSDTGMLKAEVILGRGLWLFSMRHLLTRTAGVLRDHDWTILSPPDHLRWFTTDDPVIRLNYYGPRKYDFDGGWGKPGTEILLPISPEHLLYTQVGQPARPYQKSTHDEAKLIRRLIAEHAHRIIFLDRLDSEVSALRPRIINSELLSKENAMWRNWHEEQTAAETELSN